MTLRSQQARLGDLLADITAGVSLTGQRRHPERDEVGILTLDAINSRSLEPGACKAIPKNIASQLGPHVKAGTILMGRSNTPELVGSCVYVEEDRTDRYLPDLIWQIEMRKDVPCDARWLVTYFRSSSGRRNLLRAAAGTSGSMIKLSMDRLRKLKIVVPPLVIQGRLIEISTLFDCFIATLEALEKAKREYRRGLAQQLLSGKLRLSAFPGGEWIEVRLGEVFKERAETDLPDLPLLSVTGDRGIILRSALEKRDTSSPDKSKYKRVAVGDIAYNTMRMWQGVSGLSLYEGIVSPAYTVVAPTDRVYGSFAKHLFKYAPVVHLFHRYSQGLVDDTLNLKYDRFSKIRVRIPGNVEEQQKIAEILDLCDVELSLLASQRKQLEIYKGGLLSRLWFGEDALDA